jgi:hypothetical protein
MLNLLSPFLLAPKKEKKWSLWRILFHCIECIEMLFLIMFIIIFWCRLMAKAWIVNAMFSLILNFGLVNTNVVCANVNNHITCHVKSYPSFYTCAFYKTYLGICINTCITCVHINFEHMHTMMCVFFSLCKHELWCNIFLIQNHNLWCFSEVRYLHSIMNLNILWENVQINTTQYPLHMQKKNLLFPRFNMKKRSEIEFYLFFN